MTTHGMTTVEQSCGVSQAPLRMRITPEQARALAVRMHTDTCRCAGDLDACRAYQSYETNKDAAAVTATSVASA